MEIEDFYKNKIILITGGSGSIGKEICRNLLKYDIKLIKIISNDIGELLEFKEDFYDNWSKFNLEHVDIRNLNELDDLFYNVDYVIHAAAYKFVPEAEEFRDMVYDTNINGTKNVIKCSGKYDIKKFIYLSSDKAVNPISYYGMTKLIGEYLTRLASKKYKNTIFSVTRFGNVLFSNRSVVPIVKEQIQEREPITITDLKMTRFYLKPVQAAEIVIKGLYLSKGDEIFLKRMPIIKTGDIIDALIDKYSKDKTVKIERIGIRPGEKIYEEILYDDEISAIKEIDDLLVIERDIDNGGYKEDMFFKGDKKYIRKLLDEVE